MAFSDYWIAANMKRYPASVVTKFYQPLCFRKATVEVDVLAKRLVTCSNRRQWIMKAIVVTQWIAMRATPEESLQRHCLYFASLNGLVGSLFFLEIC